MQCGVSRVLAILIAALAVLGAAASPGVRDAGDWRDGPPLATGRSEIHAAVANGTIYVAGGIGFLRTLQSCEAFDPDAAAWHACPDLPHAMHHVAIASDGVSVFAAGGYDSLRFMHDRPGQLLRLDHRARAWVRVTDLPQPIGEHAMVHHGGALFLVGGRSPEGDSAATWRFDLATQQWSARAAMPTARHSHALVMLGGEIWALGGRSSALGSRIAAVEVYDPARDRWRTAKPLPQGGGGIAAIALRGRLHVFGGEQFDPDRVLARHHVFDPASGSWSALPSPPVPTHGLAAVTLGDRIYLLGGGTQPGLRTVLSTSRTLQIWTPAS